MKRKIKITVHDEKEKKVKVPKEKKVRTKRERKIHKWFVTFVVLDVLAFSGLFIVYGPFAFFRDFWISSAMTTMTHQYFARVFYNEETIEKTIANNYVDDNVGDTNAALINFDEIEETEVYESIYEEQILKKDEGNDLYKVIEVSGKNYKGHIVVLYDASKIELVQSSKLNVGGQILNGLAKDKKAVVATNASGFKRVGKALKIKGAVIIDGKLVSDYYKPKNGTGIIGFTKENVLVLMKTSPQEAIKAGVEDGMEFGPFLVVNGQKTKIVGDGGWGVAPRTAIAQRQDGIVLMVVIDGRRPGHSIGINMKNLAELLIKYKAYNAANLDGGGSSSMFVKNKIISVAGGYGYSGDRYLPNAWIIKK